MKLERGLVLVAFQPTSLSGHPQGSGGKAMSLFFQASAGFGEDSL